MGVEKEVAFLIVKKKKSSNIQIIEYAEHKRQSHGSRS
jgi:hypothetical protein